MTVAVCLSCGEFKTGAFASCPKCSHHPVTLDDRAASFICCDQCSTVEDLKSYAKRIKRGERLKFRPDDLAKIKSVLAETQKNIMKK